MTRILQIILNVFPVSLILLEFDLTYADQNHDVNLIVGDRAQAFGGAFTALANDASASHYNPAGIAFLEKRSLTGTVASYYQRKKTYKGIFGSASYEENSIGALQSFFGAAAKLGNSKFAGGFTLYSPDVGLTEQSTDFNSVGNETLTSVSEQELLKYRRNQSQRMQSLVGTVTLAARMTQSFSVGASIGYSRDDMYFVSNQTAQTKENTLLQRFTLTTTKYSYLFEQIHLNLGIRWQITKGSSFGFRYQKSHFNLQNYSFLQESTTFLQPLDSLGNQQNNADNVTSSSYSEQSSEPISKPHEQYRIGYAQKIGRTFTIAADATYSTKNTTTNRFFARKAILNAALGMEWLPKGKFQLGLGGFTNFDASRESNVLSDDSRGEYVNLFGTSAIFGVKSKSSIYGLSYQRSEGIGKAQKIPGKVSSFYAQEHILTLNISQAM